MQEVYAVAQAGTNRRSTNRQNRHNPDFRQGLPILLNCQRQPVRYYRRQKNSRYLRATARVLVRFHRATKGWLETMHFPTKISPATTMLLWGVLAASASAQLTQSPLGPVDYYHDLQVFAPVELDFGNEPCGRCDGYFFVYDKLYWSMTGERIALGAPDRMREAPPVWFDRNPLDNQNPYTGVQFPPEVTDPNDPNSMTGIPEVPTIFDGTLPVDPATGRPLNPDTGNPINRPLLMSNILSGLPNAKFAWGDRYEFGVVEDGRGWAISVLDGPEQEQGRFYGMGPAGIDLNGDGLGDGILDGDRFNDDVPGFDLNGNGILDTFGFQYNTQEQQGGLASPLGSVYVAFNYEPGLMHGFIDVRDNTTTDPFGRILATDSDGDGILDGDGFADDIDEDGQHGGDGVDLDGDGDEPDALGAIVPDYDDLVELPTSFQTVFVRNSAEVKGVELMRMHVINNRHFKAANQNHHFEMYYGLRYMRFQDQFFFDADGGVLGRTKIHTAIDNNLFGPQLAVRWHNQRGRWSTNFQGRALLGYNVSNWTQDGFLGEDLIPGANNHPLYLRPTSFGYSKREDDFSPVAELRLEGTYRVTKKLALKLGWTGTFIGNVHRAATHINWELPKVGLLDRGSDDLWMNGWNGGIEFNY